MWPARSIVHAVKTCRNVRGEFSAAINRACPVLDTIHWVHLKEPLDVTLQCIVVTFTQVRVLKASRATRDRRAVFSEQGGQVHAFRAHVVNPVGYGYRLERLKTWHLRTQLLYLQCASV